MAFRMKAGTCKSKVTLENKIAIITGCNTGIGKETVRDLTRRGAYVIMACRDVKKGALTADEIVTENASAKISILKLDLASFQSIRQFAKRVLEIAPQIHILINNAGVMMCPHERTTEGFELQFGTNYLGHFYLTELLLDRIIASAPARIINLSSVAHSFGRIHWADMNMHKKYHPFHAYCQSKLAVLMFTKELAKRLEGTGVSTYAVHPGLVQSELGRHVATIYNRPFAWLIERVGKAHFKTPLQGAQTTIHCAVDESLSNESGFYYSDCKRKNTSATRNEDANRRLWEITQATISAIISQH